MFGDSVLILICPWTLYFFEKLGAPLFASGRLSVYYKHRLEFCDIGRCEVDSLPLVGSMLEPFISQSILYCVRCLDSNDIRCFFSLFCSFQPSRGDDQILAQLVSTDR